MTQEMYQTAYNEWNRRSTHVSRLALIEERRNSGRHDEHQLNLNIDTKTAHTIDSSSSADLEQRPRCVTPEANAIDNDIKELLQPFINHKYLKEIDFFSGDNDNFRKEIKAFGCQLQKKENEKQYKVLAKDDNDDLLSNHVKDPNKYVRFLDRFACPFRQTAIQDFLQLSLELDKEGIDILQLKKFGGSRGHGKQLVAVIPSTEPKYYYNNAMKWMPRLLEALIVDDDHEDQRQQYIICFEMIKVLRKLSVEAFEDACRTMSSSAVVKKLDVHTQIAACGPQGANFSYEQLRKFRRYLIQANLNILQPEYIIRQHEMPATVSPVCSSFRENKSKRNAWTLPVKDAAEEKIKAVLLSTVANTSGPTGLNGQSGFSNSDHGDRLSSATAWCAVPQKIIHLVVGADHGGGSFKAEVGLNFVDGDTGRVIHQELFLVAVAECKKDTRKVLIDSGVAKAVDDGILEATFCLALKYHIPMEIFGSFDLAAKALLLGKCNMAGRYCWRGKWRHGEDPCKACQPWTLKTMKEFREKVDNKEQETGKKIKGKQRMGLVHAPLINCIPIKNWLTPLLHSVTLFANTPFNYLVKWVWYRADDLPIDMIVARDNKAKALINRDESQQMLRDVEEHLNNQQQQFEEMEPIEGVGFATEEHIQIYNLQLALVASAQAAVDEAKALEKAADKELREAKKQLKTLEDNTTEYGKTTREVWMSIQRMLKAEFGVHPSSYHGGDMEGNQCRVLMRRAPEIMARIESFLLDNLNNFDVGSEERERRANEAELKLFCKGFQYIFQYMDLLSHFGYQPAGSLTDADMVDVRTCVERLTKLWKKLMPTCPVKVHAWQHLVEDLERLRGLKEYDDSNIEVYHQVMKKHNRRVGNLGDFQKKTMSILKSEATAGKRQVKEAHDMVEANRKRNKRTRIDSKQQQSVANRVEYLKSILDQPAINEEFSLLEELSKLYYLEEEEEDNDALETASR